MLAYYFQTLLFLAFFAILYPCFRAGVHDWFLKKGLGKIHIRKLKKGGKNFWWYQALHTEIGMGLLYPLNLGFTLLYVLTLGLSLILGWWKPASVVLCCLMFLLGIFSAIMLGFALIRSNIEEHGRPLVLFARRKYHGYDSIVFNVVAVLFCLLVGYAHVLLTKNL